MLTSNRKHNILRKMRNVCDFTIRRTCLVSSQIKQSKQNKNPIILSDCIG